MLKIKVERFKYSLNTGFFMIEGIIKDERECKDCSMRKTIESIDIQIPVCPLPSDKNRPYQGEFVGYHELGGPYPICLKERRKECPSDLEKRECSPVIH